jgi:spore germination protein KB
MGLVQLNAAVFGKVVGGVVSFLYFLYFFSLVVLNTSDISGFMTTYMLPETPPVAIIVPFIVVAIIAARKGVDAVFRIGGLFSLLQLAVLASLRYCSYPT